jgi:hypothetical protein
MRVYATASAPKRALTSTAVDGGPSRLYYNSGACTNNSACWPAFSTSAGVGGRKAQGRGALAFKSPLPAYDLLPDTFGETRFFTCLNGKVLLLRLSAVRKTLFFGQKPGF